jgi:hypothetical protein
MASYLDYLFPPQQQQPVPGLLGEEDIRRNQQMAQRAGLLNTGLGIIAASGPSRMPQGNILQSIAPGLMAGQQAYQGTLAQQQAQLAERAKALEPKLTTVKEGDIVYRTDPRTNLTEEFLRGAPKPVAEPAKIAEFNAAREQGLIDPNMSFPQYQMMGKGPLVQNIIGGGKLTPGQEAIDKKFADDYIAWRGGGGQDMVAQIAQLKPVIESLEAGKPITGVKVAVQPDLLLAITNPKALQSREQVEEVVQRNLRAVLGAQFTEKEGERLIARAYNPKLGPDENAKRLRRLFLQMSTAAEQKQAMTDYFDQNGTLRGFSGKMPSVQDFYKAMEGEPQNITTQGATQENRKPAPAPARGVKFLGFE